MGEESAARVTSHVVAAEAGVSQATVARVFSSPDKVALATQERVRDAAARLGYVPNAIARSLKSRRTDIVGAVVPAQSEYWQNVLTAFSRRLVDQGKQLLLFSFDDADHVEEALDSVEQLAAQRPDPTLGERVRDWAPDGGLEHGASLIGRLVPGQRPRPSFGPAQARPPSSTIRVAGRSMDVYEVTASRVAGDFTRQGELLRPGAEQIDVTTYFLTACIRRH
jgi:hypothetical protein